MFQGKHSLGTLSVLSLCVLPSVLGRVLHHSISLLVSFSSSCSAAEPPLSDTNVLVLLFPTGKHVLC